MTDRLFVYGTLGPGGPNEDFLRRIGGRFVAASVRGRLAPAGWGAAAGYPGLILDRTAGPVSGHLFVSDNLARVWSRLDEFEGDEYRRVTAMARLADGTEVEAWVYVLRSVAAADGRSHDEG